jgi:hypothetical protein
MRRQTNPIGAAKNPITRASEPDEPQSMLAS